MLKLLNVFSLKEVFLLKFLQSISFKREKLQKLHKNLCLTIILMYLCICYFYINVEQDNFMYNLEMRSKNIFSAILIFLLF